jgi:hypothetical protein
VNCPFCAARAGSDDVKHHLHISLDKEVCHCFKCDYKRDWTGLVMDVTGLDYFHSIGELYTVPNPVNYLKMFDSDLVAPVVVASDVSMPDDFVLLGDADGNIARRARKYLVNRGFAQYDWSRYQLGVANSVGYRVIIPIEDDYWQGRGLYPFIQPKYTGPKGAETSHVLFNSKALELYDEVVVCEGAFSAMAVGENAIALVGKNITPEKLTRMTQSDVRRFIVTIEPGAEENMIMLADGLNALGKGVTLWRYHTGDPADSDDYVQISYDMRAKVAMLLEN